MATTKKQSETIKNQLANKTNGQAVQNQQPAQAVTLKHLLNDPTIKNKFEQMLRDRAPQFISSIINLYNSEGALKKCNPMTVISSAMVAATLDLPVDKNLGYAWIIPYGNQAQFQLGYKGYIQLALRTAQYRYINVTPIYEGELVSWNRLTEEFVIDFDKKESETIIGYAAYFELLNGFRKTVYWTKAEVEAHKNKFSKSDFGWKRDWDAMAMKTVVRNMLSKWGILSVQMQKAFSEEVEEGTDRKEIHDDENSMNVIDIDDLPLMEEQTQGEVVNEQ